MERSGKERKLMTMPKKFYDFLLIKKGFGDVTIDGYRRVLSKFFRDIKTENPTQKQSENYITEMRKKPYSFSHIINTSVAIGRFMEFIKKPIKIVHPRKPKSLLKDVMTEGEVARILAATKNSREKAMLGILAYSGIRNKELCSLKAHDINLDDNVIRVIGGKFSKDRVVNISKECAKIISEYFGQYLQNVDGQYLFTTLREGKQYNGWALRKVVKVVSRRAKIKKRVYPHLFRHSLACNLLNRGANIMTIKELLGHSKIETTLIYAHSTPQRVQSEYNYFCPAYS